MGKNKPSFIQKLFHSSFYLLKRSIGFANTFQHRLRWIYPLDLIFHFLWPVTFKSDCFDEFFPLCFPRWEIFWFFTELLREMALRIKEFLIFLPILPENSEIFKNFNDVLIIFGKGFGLFLNVFWVLMIEYLKQGGQVIIEFLENLLVFWQED